MVLAIYSLFFHIHHLESDRKRVLVHLGMQITGSQQSSPSIGFLTLRIQGISWSSHISKRSMTFQRPGPSSLILCRASLLLWSTPLQFCLWQTTVPQCWQWERIHIFDCQHKRNVFLWISLDIFSLRNLEQVSKQRGKHTAHHYDGDSAC